jgi:hypothetical protein
MPLKKCDVFNFLPKKTSDVCLPVRGKKDTKKKKHILGKAFDVLYFPIRKKASDALYFPIRKKGTRCTYFLIKGKKKKKHLMHLLPYQGKKDAATS